MIKEVVDPVSGAILFKKDQESLDLEYLMKKVKELESSNRRLEKRIKKLEESMKEDS